MSSPCSLLSLAEGVGRATVRETQLIAAFSSTYGDWNAIRLPGSVELTLDRVRLEAYDRIGIGALGYTTLTISNCEFASVHQGSNGNDTFSPLIVARGSSVNLTAARSSFFGQGLFAEGDGRADFEKVVFVAPDETVDLEGPSTEQLSVSMHDTMVVNSKCWRRGYILLRDNVRLEMDRVAMDLCSGIYSDASASSLIPSRLHLTDASLTCPPSAASWAGLDLSGQARLTRVGIQGCGAIDAALSVSGRIAFEPAASLDAQDLSVTGAYSGGIHLGPSVNTRIERVHVTGVCDVGLRASSHGTFQALDLTITGTTLPNRCSSSRPAQVSGTGLVIENLSSTRVERLALRQNAGLGADLDLFTLDPFEDAGLTFSPAFRDVTIEDNPAGIFAYQEVLDYFFARAAQVKFVGNTNTVSSPSE